MWDLPGPGIEPVSPALAGEFLTTVPPGKTLVDWFDESPNHMPVSKLTDPHHPVLKKNIFNCVTVFHKR